MEEQADQPDTYEVKAPQGHTFVVSAVQQATPVLTAVPVMKPAEATLEPQTEHEQTAEQPCCSSQAVVPLSSSLPSKLLRLHAKRSAQALLHQLESMDSQFGSGSEDTPMSPSAPPLSPLPLPMPAQAHANEDVGMGSSIGDSEESEEDDELKPLAVDNHIMQPEPEPERSERQHSPPAVPLSEANLEKFRKHHMDNIYLHPNFSLDASPPPAVAPANSPVLETRRVHRSFLSMKKPSVEEEQQQQEQPTPQQELKPLAVEQPQQEQANEIDTLDPSLVPSDELAAEIADAVEFYFSNESILKDAFLLKHVRRNKEGFVSLKLVSSFKRVRQLTREWKVVGDAVRRKSRKIELNEQGTKVRRLEPLPSFDETMPSRTIVACDLPLDKLSIEKVSDLFSKCGEIALIRILKPGMAIPVDVRQFMNKYPELQQKECALVEYLESSSAREARHLAGPFQVYEMVAPKKKTGKKAAVIQLAAPVARMVENYRYYNEANCERTRGGSFSGLPSHEPLHDLRFKLKRNNSDFQPSYYQQQQLHQQPVHPLSTYHAHGYQHYQPRGSISMLEQQQQQQTAPPSPGFFGYAPRRYSNTSTISASTAAALGEPLPSPSAAGGSSSSSNAPSAAPPAMSSLQRRLSNCSEQNYAVEANMSRRASNCSDAGAPQRRDSNCSESCPCSRRVSDFGQSEASYRKSSVCSNGSCPGERRYSNGSLQFERSFSNASDGNGFYRRASNDFNVDREREREREPEQQLVGGGGGGYQVWPRRYSNNFQQLSSKLAAYDNAQYIGGRRISTDSGYDRRYSFGSEYEGSPRSRTGSFLSQYDGQPRSRTGSFLDGSPRSRSGSFAQRAAESLVRTPMGPDGSKGFSGGQRARKFGQTVSPVN
ncbi:hypothetical protein KR222_006498 [Zaprionus bogoriensis]|nr:hypothetical protein KR222_006498 [Zaprionus bogoriensis]